MSLIYKELLIIFTLKWLALDRIKEIFNTKFKKSMKEKE